MMEGNKRTNWRASPSLQYNVRLTSEPQIGAVCAGAKWQRTNRDNRRVWL